MFAVFDGSSCKNPLKTREKCGKKVLQSYQKTSKPPCFQGENEDLMLFLGWIYYKMP